METVKVEQAYEIEVVDLATIYIYRYNVSGGLIDGAITVNASWQGSMVDAAYLGVDLINITASIEPGGASVTSLMSTMDAKIAAIVANPTGA